MVKEDVLFSINGISIDNDLESWLGYYSEGNFDLGIKRNGLVKSVCLECPNKVQYYNYQVNSLDEYK